MFQRLRVSITRTLLSFGSYLNPTRDRGDLEASTSEERLWMKLLPGASMRLSAFVNRTWAQSKSSEETVSQSLKRVYNSCCSRKLWRSVAETRTRDSFHSL